MKDKMILNALKILLSILFIVTVSCNLSNKKEETNHKKQPVEINKNEMLLEKLEIELVADSVFKDFSEKVLFIEKEIKNRNGRIDKETEIKIIQLNVMKDSIKVKLQKFEKLSDTAFNNFKENLKTDIEDFKTNIEDF